MPMLVSRTATPLIRGAFSGEGNLALTVPGLNEATGQVRIRSGAVSGSSEGMGNITVSGKYRFFRQVEEWGDRQAAVRFGLELPTGSNEAPDPGQVQAPAFVREQLTPSAAASLRTSTSTTPKPKGESSSGGISKASCAPSVAGSAWVMKFASTPTSNTCSSR